MLSYKSLQLSLLITTHSYNIETALLSSPNSYSMKFTFTNLTVDWGIVIGFFDLPMHQDIMCYSQLDLVTMYIDDI